MKKGIFITFEGPEGCGKSTQTRLLCDHLKRRSYDVVHTREPGGTNVGELIRRVLLDSSGAEISDLTELFLFEAARAEIVEKLIKPNLAKRRIVVCDRFHDATFSYQGYGGGVSLNSIRTLDGIARRGVTPDVTILLDVDTITGLRRARKNGVDRMERKDLAYHKRVRKGYLKLARQYPGRIRLVKVGSNIKNTQSEVRREVELVIQRYERSG